jgi:hypothetical protein
MAGLEKEIVVLPAARTPFGKFCSALKDLTATELGVIAGRAAIERAGVRPEEIGFRKESDFSIAIVPGVYCARACEVKKPHESLRCRGWSRFALLSV